MDDSHEVYTSDDDRDPDPMLTASLSDLTPHHERQQYFGSPSRHTDIRSETESEADHASVSSYNPPGWTGRGEGRRSGWYGHDARADSLSRENSLLCDPPKIPLPASRHQTPRTSPERDVIPKVEELEVIEGVREGKIVDEPAAHVDELHNNYMRFTIRADVQHRTDHVDAALSWLRGKIDLVTQSRTSLFAFSLVLLFSWLFMRVLLRAPEPAATPDLVTVASLTKSYEPLIYYTEAGTGQIEDLHDTSIAVWDLGESIRQTNMTSAPIIVEGLDELSQNLNLLAKQLSIFFASVDGDVDHILSTMEWIKRELSHVSNPHTGAFDNIHSFLSRVGLLESGDGEPTTLGAVVTELFGQTHPQRTKSTLKRTFNEFLNLMESNINEELKTCMQIFGLFEGIDRQFLNLQRTVIREEDTQEREEGELLSSLWTRVIGGNSGRLRKFQKNKDLLLSVRNRTLKNKHLLLDYNGRLLQLKSSLEILRQRLVSPLVRSNDSSTLSVEEQIIGLDDTYTYLRKVRDAHRQRQVERLYGGDPRRPGLDSLAEIEGR